MGSSDYLNSARRAAVVFFLLAAGVMGAAGYGLAVSVWGAVPVASSADAKPDRKPHGFAREIYRERSAPRSVSLKVAEGAVGPSSGL